MWLNVNKETMVMVPHKSNTIISEREKEEKKIWIVGQLHFVGIMASRERQL